MHAGVVPTAFEYQSNLFDLSFLFDLSNSQLRGIGLELYYKMAMLLMYSCQALVMERLVHTLASRMVMQEM